MKRHAVQSWDTLGVRFSSEDEKSGSAKLPGSKKRAVLCRSAGGSANFRFKVFKWRRKVRQSYLGAKSAQCRAVQDNAVQCTAVQEAEGAPASCSCLHRSLISTFQNAILWNTTNTYSQIRKYRRNVADCSYILHSRGRPYDSSEQFLIHNKKQNPK